MEQVIQGKHSIINCLFGVATVGQTHKGTQTQQLIICLVWWWGNQDKRAIIDLMFYLCLMLWWSKQGKANTQQFIAWCGGSGASNKTKDKRAKINQIFVWCGGGASKTM